MKPFRPDDAYEPDDTIMAIARDWVIRHDRGLSTREAGQFEHWRQESPSHAAAWAEVSDAWNELGAMNPRFAENSGPGRGRFRPKMAWVGLAAAAAVAFGFAIWQWPTENVPNASPLAPSVAALDGVRLVMLSDGTAVYLKPGSEVTERITPTERRVLLLRGEAHFDVAKYPTWPFVVRAGTVEVWAVGTAFNVEVQTGAIAVEVTEGRVHVAPGQTLTSTTAKTPVIDPPLVIAGQRAVVEFQANAPVSVRIATMDAKQMTEAVAWQEPLVRLAGKTMGQLAEEVQQRTGKTVTFADPDTKNQRVGGRIRVDDLENFVGLMETYGLKSQQAPDGGIILSAKEH